MEDTTYKQKWQDLILWLKNKKKIALACSGGLDSRLLALAVKNAFQENQSNVNDYKILHISGAHIPKNEEEVLAFFAKELDLEVESYNFNPLLFEEVAQNTHKRCYFCKKAIFEFMLGKTADYTLCDGTNIDDLSIYRPGLQALRELKIASPFVEVGITKSDIKNLAKELALPFFDQASQACLLTRFDYGIKPSEEKLLYIDAKERELSTTLAMPYRLRFINNDAPELHIQGEQKDLAEEEYNKIKLLLPNSPIVFLERLNAYFDKKAKLSS